MSPVLRISDATWERLFSHARSFDDKPEDIVKVALDALDEKKGAKPITEEAVEDEVRKEGNGRKLPQKEFRAPLLETMRELGGEARVGDVRRIMERKMKPLLSSADYEPVKSGEERWWNAVCWVRKNFVDEGLFANNSERGVWKLTARAEHLA